MHKMTSMELLRMADLCREAGDVNLAAMLQALAGTRLRPCDHEERLMASLTNTVKEFIEENSAYLRSIGIDLP